MQVRDTKVYIYYAFFLLFSHIFVFFCFKPYIIHTAFVADPLNPASHRELGRILELVAMPDNWGSTHVRRMMRDGDGYYVRTQLVKDVVTGKITNTSSIIYLITFKEPKH